MSFPELAVRTLLTYGLLLIATTFLGLATIGHDRIQHILMNVVMILLAGFVLSGLVAIWTVPAP